MSKYKTIEEFHKVMREKNREWYKNNSEAKKEYQRNYYKKHRDEILKKKKHNQKIK